MSFGGRKWGGGKAAGRIGSDKPLTPPLPIPLFPVPLPVKQTQAIHTRTRQDIWAAAAVAFPKKLLI